MRLLAVQLKRIGDLLLTIPALRTLKLAQPDTRVTLMLTAGTAGLLPALSTAVDAALVYRPGRPNLGIWTRLLRGGFECAIDFTGRDRSALITLASRAGERVVSRSALRKKSFWREMCYTAIVESTVRGRHTVDHYLDHLAAVGIQPSAGLPADPGLRIPPEAAARARALLAAQGLAPGAFAVIHPGSARPEKYWQPERWAEVINFCQRELGLPCALTGGRGDAFENKHLAAIRAGLQQPCANLAGKLELLTLAAVLAEARLFAGVDSGPMHLAAAWRLPQVVLFGPTNPYHWRPRHPACLVLQPGRDQPLAEAEFREHSPGKPMAGISTAAVIGCIKRLASPETAPVAGGG